MVIAEFVSVGKLVLWYEVVRVLGGTVPSVVTVDSELGCHDAVPASGVESECIALGDSVVDYTGVVVRAGCDV